MSVELDFIPVRGKESTILTQTPREGNIYFATDTGKIYMDVKDELTGELAHLPVGGSGAAVLYAQANTPAELPDGSLVLNLNDLEDETASVNIDDLIINSDGKFLRVSEVGEEEMVCRVIAVSGTGGGGGDGPSATNGTAKIEYIGQSSLTVLKGDSCELKYLLTAFDAAGDPVIGAGEATWAVNNVVKYTEIIYPGENKFDIGPYLALGAQTITLKISINTGGATNTIVRKTWTVTATELKLTWEHDLTTVYDANKNIELSWIPYGILDKTTYIIVDDIYSYSKENGTASGIQQSFTLPINLTHGSHTISMYVQAMLNGETLKTNVITHEFIVADKTDQTAPPIIVISKIAQSMSQYDTMYIPFVVYDHTKAGLTNEVIYLEDDIEKERQNINNGILFSWSYTPTTYGYKKLTIACGNTKRNLQITVNELDLGGTAEVEGYAFKLKASEFNGNNALKNWNSNGVTATFSEGFDWVNGGIKSELDESGNTRQYINVRAGDTMTINYKPFENNVSRTVGKCIKIIFKATGCRDYDAQILRCYDDVNSRGLILNAQTALFNSASNHISIPYCEDTYIELEIDITDTSNSNGFYYITSWIDGVPAGIQTFSSGEAFNHNSLITIGSEDTNVQIYMIKIYEKHINDAGHLANFIMDAPNATEMLSRFIRNDILDERGEISPTRLAEKNPNCRVHCYKIPRMTTTKDDKVKNCEYVQYHGSSSAVLSASGVTTRVQGTSSSGYGLAAYNLDAKFEKGFDYPDGSHSDGWSMDEKAIPVNYFTTKVNVASCENANNALNQEWYNKFQPYVSPNRARARADGKEARDCMQFYPGVLFIEDHNQESSFTKAEGVGNNVFKDTPGYIDNPYPKLYAVCNMGNSKKNLEVFHDVENPLECCIEVADNQNDIQKMIICAGLDTFGSENVFIPLDRLFDDEDNDIQVTYSHTSVDGVEETRTKTAYALWRNANMSKAAFEFRYPDKFGDNEGKSFEEIDVPNGGVNAKKALVGWFNFVKWMTDSNPAAATNEPLPTPVTFGSYTFTDSTFSKKLKGLTVNDFAGTYNTDSEQYRMAKMLNECEKHLVMDSVVFHYLFIERHTMVDNVAKNTFWSSGDAIHWDLTKNYDNDTSDGNDNEGKLTLTYGFEPGDQRDGVSIFNGPGSVWLEFIRRLPQVAGHLHRILENDDKGDPWDSITYLKAFEEWQSAIPERCWIEAYYRLYIRPGEVYEANYLEKLEGGKKTHQRRQYETYQNMYISSKYFGKDCENARLQFRPNVDGAKAYELPMKMYADCYVMGSLGQGTGTGSINYQRRTKRGETFNFVSPTNNLTDATAYFYPSIFYQEIGSSEKDFKFYNPKSFDFSGANKLRTLVLGNYEGEDTTLNTVLEEITFKGNSMLEELSAAGYSNVKLDLDLSGCPNLKTLDTRLSSFTSYSFAPGSPLETAYIQSPTSLNMKELSKIETFSIADYTKLIGLYLDGVDKSVGFNSLNIIKERISVNSQIDLDYNLKNIVWLETDSSQIDNNSIKYLDFLLTKNAKADGDIIDAEAGLTGTLTITSDAYNDEDSYLIYDKYSKVKADKKSYPNLDIIFTGDNASMPKITIVNQAGETVWSRRIKHNNSGIDLDFLSSGPDGAFIPFETTEDQSTIYTFTNKYLFNGIEIQGDENGYPISSTAITEDIIIEPVFDESVRQYTLTILNYDGTEIESVMVDYGTVLGTITRNILIPQRDDSDLTGLYDTYKFVGYYIGNNTSSVLTQDKLELIELRDNTLLTAAYEISHVYLNPCSENYFDCTDEGMLSLKDDYTIKGKVTIPKVVNGITVTGLDTGAFQNAHYGHVTNGLTHIFFEPLSYSLDALGNIKSYAENTNIKTFRLNIVARSGIKYFELPSTVEVARDSSNCFDNIASSNNCIIAIRENMTRIPTKLFTSYSGYIRMLGANDNTIKLPKLEYIGQNAFAGTSRMNSTSFILPSTLTIDGYVGNNAKSIQFGEPGNQQTPSITINANDGVKVWGAIEATTLYGVNREAALSELNDHFEGTINESN